MRTLLILAALIALPGSEPVEPFRIAGNIYYVGAADVTSFLITTPKGHILIDGGYPEMAPRIERNIATLGFKLKDIRIILNSHAHFDHAGAITQLQRASGATVEAGAGDVPLLARGGHDDPQFGNRFLYPPVHVDRALHDGDRITLADTALIAHATAGHTAGCTTYTMTTAGKNVVFFCSPSVPSEYRLTPDLIAAYRAQFATLKSLPCDIPLGSHGGFFDLKEKMKTHDFVDPDGCRRFIDRMEDAFEAKAK